MKGGIIDSDIKTFEQLISKINENIKTSPAEAKAMWQERLADVQKMKSDYEKELENCK